MSSFNTLTSVRVPRIEVKEGWPDLQIIEHFHDCDQIFLRDCRMPIKWPEPSPFSSAPSPITLSPHKQPKPCPLRRKTTTFQRLPKPHPAPCVSSRSRAPSISREILLPPLSMLLNLLASACVVAPSSLPMLRRRVGLCATIAGLAAPNKGWVDSLIL